MADDTDVQAIASSLNASVGMLVRRLRQAPAQGGQLTLAERSVLARLDRRGPSTSAELARIERISPQSMGATLAGLEQRGYVSRRSDRDDRRRVVVSISARGAAMLNSRRDERTRWLAEALGAELSARELEQLTKVLPLLDRVAQRP